MIFELRDEEDLYGMGGLLLSLTLRTPAWSSGSDNELEDMTSTSSSGRTSEVPTGRGDEENASAEVRSAEAARRFAEGRPEAVVSEAARPEIAISKESPSKLLDKKLSIYFPNRNGEYFVDYMNLLEGGDASKAPESVKAGIMTQKDCHYDVKYGFSFQPSTGWKKSILYLLRSILSLSLISKNCSQG